MMFSLRIFIGFKTKRYSRLKVIQLRESLRKLLGRVTKMERRLIIVAVLFTLYSAIICNPGDEDLKILQLSQCPYQVEPIGCFHDKFGSKWRALPDELINSRDTVSMVFQSPSIQWKNYHHWTANFICECAKKYFKNRPEKKSGHIGLQFFGECWANIDKYLPALYNRHGPSENCIDTSFKPITSGDPKGCGLFIGAQLTNYVYKISKFGRSCPEMKGEYESDIGDLNLEVNDFEIKMKSTSQVISLTGELENGCKGTVTLNGKNYKLEYSPETCKLTLKDGPVFTKKKCDKSIKCPFYKSRGCWNDPFPNKKAHERPMPVYAMNERDPLISNWNRILIDWRNWGEGYLASLLCRCAKLAKQTNQRFFSIQFYGECWTSNNENFMKYGNVTRCVDGGFKGCPVKDNKCRTNICAGQWKANKVYEITQGPGMCDSNPCKNDAECVTNGPEKYVCKCKTGFNGKDCGKANNPSPSINIIPDK